MFDSEVAVRIPAGLDQMEPGIGLAAFLSGIDVSELSGHDRVVVLRAHQRMASHYAAHVYRDMAAVSDSIEDLDDDPALATEAAAAEIRAALQLTRRTADAELSLALDTRRRLPRVWDLLASGAIDTRRARVMVHGTSHLSVAAARDVIERIAEVAPSLTTGQLGARLRRLCIEADPDQARDRFRDAVDQRRVVSEPTVDGTAHLLGLDLPPHRVAAITRRINHLARSLRRAGEPRTMDQLRADVLLDLLDPRSRRRDGRGTVDIRVDLTTLMGLASRPGDLGGFGPVIADIARQVARDQTEAEWRYTVTDPTTGTVAHAGTTRRRPTAADERLVQAANPCCVFPGCRMPAADCDLDHRTPHSENGPATPENLAPLCRHDHRIRHEAGWSYTRLDGGAHHWTTKLGHSYITPAQPP